MRRRPIILALVFLAAISLSAQQQPTFRSNVRLVNVTVVAHDSSGRPVMNLTAGDFQVFEDGKEEKIEVFAIDTDRPVQTATAAPQPAPALATNIFTNRQKTRDGGGVTVVLFDRLNSSWEDQKRARDQILKLLAKAQPRDRIALYVLESDTVTVLHDFTSDASRLIAVLNKYLGTTSIELAGSEDKASDFTRTGLAALDADTEAWLKQTQDMVSEQFLRRRGQLTPTRSKALPIILREFQDGRIWSGYLPRFHSSSPRFIRRRWSWTWPSTAPRVRSTRPMSRCIPWIFAA